jgi:hypothetical protein
VAQNRGYSWGIWRSLRAAVLLKALVEGVCNAESLPRNEKVVGSIPTGGSTRTPRSSEACFLARGFVILAAVPVRGPREAPGVLGQEPMPIIAHIDELTRLSASAR